MLTRRAGSAEAPRRLPGIEAPPDGRWILALRREFAESVRSQSSLRACQVALDPMKLYGSRSLSRYGLGGPMATPGFPATVRRLCGPNGLPDKGSRASKLHTHNAPRNGRWRPWPRWLSCCGAGDGSAAQKDSGLGIMANLCELMTNAAFIATDDVSDCGFCDYLLICGETKTLTESSHAKLQNLKNTALEPLRGLRKK